MTKILLGFDKAILGQTAVELCLKQAEKRGYQKGYRIGRKWFNKSMKQQMEMWHKSEQTGLESPYHGNGKHDFLGDFKKLIIKEEPVKKKKQTK
jgi:hypothetical protein